MQTRRQILLGAGAVLVAGAGVALAEADDPRARRFLHRLGLADSPDHTVPDAHVALQSGSLESTHMPHPAAWTIASPKAPIRGVVYCLHGHGNDHREAFRDVHLPDVAAAAGLPFAVGAVDGGSDSYWHARSDGSDPMTMFLDEFIPLVEQRLGVSPPRAVLGWSMGGYGALLAAERAPDLFAAVVASSPALWTSAGDTPAIAFDGESDYRRNDVFAGIEQLAPMVVRVDCGTDDPILRRGTYVGVEAPSSESGFVRRGIPRRRVLAQRRAGSDRHDRQGAARRSVGRRDAQSAATVATCSAGASAAGTASAPSSPSGTCPSPPRRRPPG